MSKGSLFLGSACEQTLLLPMPRKRAQRIEILASGSEKKISLTFKGIRVSA
jgi:hypothetical protein